jgi:hypothetical protein
MHALALLLAALLADEPPAPRAKADEPIPVKLLTNTNEDGQNNVLGTVSLKAITVKGKNGTMEIPAGKLASVRTSSRSIQEGPILVVETTDQQRFEGLILAPKALEVAGKYGRFSASWADVHSLDVVGRRAGEDNDAVAEESGPPWIVRIETDRGDKIGGPLYDVSQGAIESVDIDCDFGGLSVDAEKVRSIEFDDGGWTEHEGVDTQKSGTIHTTDGRKLAGMITIPSTWVVDTDLGLLGLKAGKLKSITIEAAAKPEAPKADLPAKPARTGRVTTTREGFTGH